MKKTVLFMAVAVTLLSAVSCGEKKNNGETAPEATTVAETTTMPDFQIKTVPITEAAEEDIEYEDPIAGTAFVKGNVEGNVYTSEYAGIKFTAPDEWKFKSEEDIFNEQQQMLSGMTGELKRIAAMEITDAAIFNDKTNKNIDFTYSNVKLKYPDESGMTEEEFLDKDIFMGNLKEFKESYGLDIKDPEKVKLGNKEFTRFRIVNAEKGDDVLYIGRIDDDFMLTIAAYGGAASDDSAFESCFEALD